MLSRVWLVNAILAIALGICSIHIWEIWHAPMPVLSHGKTADAGKDEPEMKLIPDISLARESAYRDVVDKNLFSSLRMAAPPEPEVLPSAEIQDVRISGEKIVLFGVIMLDGYKRALINNPEDKKSSTRWIHEGEQIGNLKVSEIMDDEVVFVDGMTAFRVMLYDPEKASKVSGKSPAKAQPEDNQPKVISAGAEPAPKAKGLPPRNEKAEISADGKYEIVDTPLGKIKRKRR